jgi:5-formyltetrahydrofolate cyclo-ligase
VGDRLENGDLGGLRQAKMELRLGMRKLRAAIPAPERDRLGELAERRLLELPEVRGASTVAAFLSFGTEIPTGSVVAACVARGQRVVIPFVEERELRMAPYRPGDLVVRSRLGVEEPTARPPIEPEELDVVVVPGLAFDRAGYRLGNGGGHYDRFLLLLRRDAASIGLAFHDQLLPEVPHGPADTAVDLVVTDREVVRARRSGGSFRRGGS